MENKVVWAYYGHEPSYHLKRMHSSPSTFCLGEWADAWQDKTRTEESIKRLKSLGINLIYTTFFKGFGLKFEKEEIEKTKKLVEICHKYDIKVLGYLQLGSIYYETFLSETKSCRKMAARTSDGGYQLWAGSYYRWDTCYNSKEFKSYIKKVVNYGLDNAMLDGFHFDNSFIALCYCDRCRKDFRKWLKYRESNPRIMGLNDFKNVDMPPFKMAAQAKNYDALFYLWQEYRQNKLAEFHNEIFKYTKEKSNYKAIIVHNPAFPRDSGSFMLHGYNPELSSKYCDFVFAENDDVLVREDGFLTTQILSYKLANAFDYKVLETSWLLDENGHNIYPRTYFEIAYYLSVSMIFGDVVGSTWIMRSTHENDKTLLENELQYNTHKKVISYYLENHNLYGGKATSNVKVLYYNPNLINSPREGFDKFKRVVNLLNNNFVNFSVISTKDLDSLTTDDILILPNMYFTTDELLSKIRTLSDSGIKTVAYGDFNVCNLYGRARDLTDKKNHFDNLNKISSEDELLSFVKNNLKKSITANLNEVVFELKEDKDNIYLHLLSTIDRKQEKLELTFNGFEKLKGVEVHSYEDVKFSFTDKTIAIDNFSIMATIKIPK